jgi:predicted Fe-Mo cluster-binding NifX family protein
VVVVLIVARTGWKLISDGMRVLLDASLDPETLGKARAAIEAHPAVVRINALTGRNAERYRFLETEISLRLNDLEKAHLVSHAIEEVIRTKIPHLERVLVHIEPYRKPVQRVAVALVDQEGRVSKRFGTASYFAFSDMGISDGVEERRHTAPNPHRDDEKHRGIKVARWLLDVGADVVICGERISDKGPGYLLRDAGVRTMATESTDLESVLGQWEDIFHDGHPPSGPGVESRTSSDTSP